jgi:hypothetical protein
MKTMLADDHTQESPEPFCFFKKPRKYSLGSYGPTVARSTNPMWTRSRSWSTWAKRRPYLTVSLGAIDQEPLASAHGLTLPPNFAQMDVLHCRISFAG